MSSKVTEPSGEDFSGCLEYEIDSVWLACAIDSEGSIGLCKGGRWFEPEINTSNNSYSYMRNVGRILNKEVKERCGKGNRKEKHYYINVCSQQESYDVLSRVLPYLIIKIEQATLLMEWCNTRLKREQYHKLPTERELEIYNELKELNRRGLY